MFEENNQNAEHQPATDAAPEIANESPTYTDAAAPADKERLDAEYEQTKTVDGTGAQSTSTPDAEGKNEAGAAVPKGSVDDVTASDDERLKDAYASFNLGMNILGQHSASNIPGSLFYQAFLEFKAAKVGFDAVLGDKK